MTILVTILIAYGLITLMIYVRQGKMVFFPERVMLATPEMAGLAYDDVSIQTSDGVTLHGWFVPNAQDSPVLLFFHGNAGNISGRIPIIELYVRLGFSVFILDYRGYGKSGGRISEKGSYRDADAAWSYLTQAKGIPESSIVLLGRSLGGAVAIELASRQAPGALIVESTFTSIPDVGAHHYPWLPVRFLSRIKYPSIRRIPKVTCPKLFIHSPGDEIIPFAHGRKLFEAASEPKTFLEIEGDHNSGFDRSRIIYAQGVSAFLASITQSGD